jgi:hypothetical protein
VTDLETALRELRLAVGQAVTPPPPAAIRARAGQRRPARPIVIGLVAATAVISVLVGAAAVVRDVATAPPQPGRPTPSITARPDPRPSRSAPSWPVAPETDPITRVAWLEATISVPAHEGCPAGQVRLRDGESAGYPRLLLAKPPSVGARPAHGDLTGDGRPEAVLYAECRLSAEDSGDGQGQLLAVTRNTNGALRALGWVGERGALYPEFWVAGGTLYADAVPWHTDWGYSLGEALAYRWTGTRFEAVDSGYPGLPGTAVDLRPVAPWLGCPGAVVSYPQGEYVATVGDYSYDVTPVRLPDGSPHRLDLAGDGRRYLLLAIACRQSEVLGQGVLVLDGFRAVDLVPVELGYGVTGWSFSRGTLAIEVFQRGTGEPAEAQRWVWNGSNFQPAT